MKPLKQYIKEKLIINKDYVDVNILTPKSFDELRKIIKDRYDKLGPGTNKKNPIDFNDINVSNLNSFYDKNIGIFDNIDFIHIDISKWDVSNVTNMSHMFCRCSSLKSVGDLSSWDVSNVIDMSFMFQLCKKFNQDLSEWNVSSVTNMGYMFDRCHSFNKCLSNWDVSNVTNMENMFWNCKNFNQDISKWNVSNVTDMSYMFAYCENFNQDLSKWNVSKVKYKTGAFLNCPIKRKYKSKFK